ncbi:MAG: Mfa1 family fimbria major subunit [Muribaculaceae bacterium]|nr:Mfa1 family fimbria major subunit [Muribaculaceae bacterium]
MKVSYLNKSLLVMGALAMVACSNDDFSRKGSNSLSPGEEAAGVYMALNIEMPSGRGTRSQTNNDGTSTDGVEVGTNTENNVASVLIVLAKASDNSFIFAGEVPTSSIVPNPSDNSYNTTVQFQKSDLVEYYNKNNGSTNGDLSADEQRVNVFAICNPPTKFSEYIESAPLGDTEWYNQTETLLESTADNSVNQLGSVTNSIWSTDLFVMSNSAIATRRLPPTLNDWDKHKTPDTAFDLSGVNHPGDEVNEIDNSGSVLVERVACRFDFKDGSQQADDPSGIGNTYNVVYDVIDGERTPIIQVELTKMMLTNMAKDFYILPRVSPNGQLANSTLCGKETRTNYLVGPNAIAFNFDETPDDFVYSDYFNYPLFKSTYSEKKEYNIAQWNAWQLSEVLGGANDNLHQEYKVWRYATENVIPAPVSNQEYGKTTVVVFKGRFQVPEALKDNPDYSDLYKTLNGETISGNPNTDPILYSNNGQLYLTWSDVTKAAISASVQMTDNVPDVVEIEEEIDGEKVKVNQFASVSRSNPLFRSVYGANAGMSTFKWGTTTYKVGDGITPADPEENTIYVREPEQNPLSPNSMWNAWNNAGKPATGTTLTNMREAMTSNGFKLYQSSIDQQDGAGYYCYYFYRNRHNDNLDPGTMGPMEFATVRNNVYKLAVTNISQLGHPRIPENDPEPPTPDTPDESDEVYLTVTCQVLPWTVRVNNIEF